VVGVVGHGLDTAVGKAHLVGSLDNTVVVLCLGLLKGGTAVLILHPDRYIITY